MNSKQLQELNSAYQSVYGNNLTEQVDICEEDFDFEIEEIVEEVILSAIEEGYTFEEIEEAFDDSLVEEILSEAKVTMGQGSTLAAKARVEKRKAARAAEEQEARSERRKARVEKIKSSAKGAIEKARQAPQRAKAKVEAGVETAKKKAHEPLVSYAGKRDLYTSKAGKKLVGSAKSAKMASTTRGSERRAELRSKVAQDVKSRAAAKVERAKGKASAAMTSAKEAPGKAKRSLKKAARGALLGLARRLKEEGGELDTFDLVAAYMIDEGFASDYDGATALMSKLSSELVDDICESQMALISEETQK